MNFKCPYCGSDLTSGRTRIHGTLFGFLLVGFSYQNLYFQPDYGNEIKILGNGNSATALKCSKCDVVILNKSFSDSRAKIDTQDFDKLPRDKVYHLIKIWSSKVDQEELIKKRSDYKSELFDRWINIFKPDSSEIKDLFEFDEFSMFCSFDWELKEIFKKIKNTDLNYQDFIQTDDWIKLNGLAKYISDSLNLD